MLGNTLTLTSSLTSKCLACSEELQVKENGSLVPVVLEKECREGSKEGGVAEASREKLGNERILLAEVNKVFYADDAASSPPCTSFSRTLNRIERVWRWSSFPLAPFPLHTIALVHACLNERYQRLDPRLRKRQKT